jgi:hypothetical protein
MTGLRILQWRIESLPTARLRTEYLLRRDRPLTLGNRTAIVFLRRELECRAGAS